MSSIKHLANIKIQDDYETPEDLFYDLCNKYKIFPTLDVCSTKENSKCLNCITEQEDSLLYQWTETFFMNPPYSKVAKFMKKALKVDRLLFWAIVSGYGSLYCRENDY